MEIINPIDLEILLLWVTYGLVNVIIGLVAGYLVGRKKRRENEIEEGT